jgi:hypothetical protein
MLMPTALVAFVFLGHPGQDRDARPPDTFKPDPGWKALGKALWFDPKSRTLVMRARVALRKGALEHFLCGTNTKEHESVLATDAPAYQIHAGLLLTGAQVGHPVRFQPKFEPPSGTPIRIDVEWVEKGTTRKADAREWVRDERTKEALKVDWVFAGSEFYEDPETKKQLYAAAEGDLITVANFTSAILDVPLASPDSDVDRLFVANTEKVPPEGTYVTLYLRPRTAPRPNP